ncbi:MAG TPA: ABC transporter ATP-binding protein [Acidimicrobiales bacterium]|nr:ABC transporter ATP-binding protein [Acidimicrobiales bacterium]
MPDKSVRDFVAIYLRPHRSRLVLLAVLFFAGTGLQLTNPLLAKSFIDRAADGAPFADLIRIAAAFLAVALLTQISTVVEVYVAEDLGWRTTNALRVDLTAHVLGLDASFHAEHGAGEMLERIDGDVSAIAGFFGRFVVNVLGSAVFLAGVLVLLWREDWRVGALLTAFAAASVLYLTRGGGFVGRRSHESRVVHADIAGYLEERLSALPDIKANGGDGATMRGLRERLARRFNVDRDALLAASLFSGAANAALAVATLSSLATAAWLERRGAISLGGVYLVFRYTGMLRMPLERLSRHMNSFQRAMGAIVRVRELMATQRRVTDGAGTLPSGALAVEFLGVDFAYERQPVLRDVSFRVEPGHVLGVVGRTGSGKTTLARLTFRLYDPDRGVVRVGDADVRDLRVDGLQRHIGLVTQDVQLFAGTLRDNVSLFDPDVRDDRLFAVFESLGLHAWLAEFPDGLDTVLGPNARGLSAGEAQLVALTRVFLENPGVVVLDEASSRLDPQTEALLEDAVDRLLAGRTGIVIAHRLHTVQRADAVLVLDDGRVVEHGSRASLAADPTSRFAALLRTGLSEVTA